MKYSNQKGFALILSIFFMVALMVMVAGGFLSLTRTQHEHVRGQERLETAWAARGVIEMMIKQIDDFRQTHDCLPQDGGIHSGQAEAASCFGAAEKDVTKILADLDTAIVGSPLIAGNPLFTGASPKFSVGFKGLEVADVGAQNAYREYLLKVQIKDNKSGWVTERSQKIRTGSGKIFDYAVFYENDLELSPGSGATVQGPLFTNGNMYLMPGSGTSKALNLIGPDGAANQIANNYILKAAGHIYAFYKPVLARNYLTDINEYYRTSTPDYYHDIDEETYNVEIMDHPLLDVVAPYSPRAPVKGKPFVYYLRNDTYNFAEDKYYSALAAGRANPSIINIDGIYPQNGMPLQFSDIVMRPGFQEVMWHPVYWNTKEYIYTTTYVWENSAASSYAGDMSTSNRLDWSIFEKGLTVDTNNIKPFNQPNLSGNYQLDMQSVNPGVNPNWSTLITSGALKGKVFEAPQPEARVLTIPIGTQGTNKHVLIESLIDPVADCTDSHPDLATREANQAAKLEEVRVRLGAKTPFTVENCQAVHKLQFIEKADIVISCVNDCKSFDVTIKNWDSSDGDPNDATIDFFVKNYLRDDRLKRVLGGLMIDVSSLKDFWENSTAYSSVLGRSGAPLTVYVQTESFKNGTDLDPNCTLANSQDCKIRLVEVTNAASIPKAGMTIATNGRLWVHGDFNITTETGTCKGGTLSDRSYPDCVKDIPGTPLVKGLPSAALIADSIGVLSNTYNFRPAVFPDHLDFTKHPKVGTDGSPSDLSLHAGIIAGYIESQLERRYPDCDGKDANGHFSYAGCWDPLYMASRLNSAGTLPSNVSCNSGFSITEGPAGHSDTNCNAYFDNGNFYATDNLFKEKTRNMRTLVLTEAQKYWDYLTADADKNKFFPVPAGLPSAPRPVIPGANDETSSRIVLPVIMDPRQVARGDATEFGTFNTSELASNHILLYAINPASALPGCAGSHARPAFGDIPCEPEKNVDNLPQFIWYPLADALTNWVDLTDSTGLTLTRKEHDPAFRTNLNALSDVTRQYVVYWRQLNFDFTLPAWPVPMTSTGGYVTTTLPKKNCWPFSATCMPEAVTPWPGVWSARLDLNPSTNYANVFGTPVGNTYLGQYPHADISCENPGEGINGPCPSRPINLWYRPFIFYDTIRHPATLKPVDTTPESAITYQHGRKTIPYILHYSGGVENLINFQEEWIWGTLANPVKNASTFYFSGTLAAPWFSQELWVKGPTGAPQLAFFASKDPNGLSFYSAPKRKIDYNEQLSLKPPPSTPNLYETKRLSYEEKAV